MSALQRTIASEDDMATTAGIAGRRAVVALLAAIAALLGAGALMLGGGRGAEGHGHGTATSGVALPGGVLRVDSVTPEAPMQMHGMPMGTGPGMKNVPKGERRFTVAVTVFAGEGKGLRVAAEHFSVSADATAPRRPIDDDTDVVFVPAGASFPRRL